MLTILITLLGLAGSIERSVERTSAPSCGPDAFEVVGHGEFTVVSGSGRTEVAYQTPANLVFCQRTSTRMTWIRLAELTAADGQEGPHLDIDLCNVSESESFTAMPARETPCPGGPTWALWWHDRDGNAFANGPGSADCTLTLTVHETGLSGSFSCRGLLDAEGEASVDVLNGSFQCEWREGSESPTGFSDPR